MSMEISVYVWLGLSSKIFTYIYLSEVYYEEIRSGILAILITIQAGTKYKLVRNSRSYNKYQYCLFRNEIKEYSFSYEQKIKR